jgi:hypothetical protein
MMWINPRLYVVWMMIRPRCPQGWDGHDCTRSPRSSRGSNASAARSICSAPRTAGRSAAAGCTRVPGRLP